MSSRPQPPPSSASRTPQTPKTIKLRPHAILSLPYRLTHPPPPPPKASSWGITPHFRIPLDEILDRKHLPPLGLKDFEEWLLFIDRMPECLYFILWLREYKLRYTAWRRQSKPSTPIRCSSSPCAPTYRSLSAPPPPNPALTQFYMRAKETFLTPYAPYALPVPQDLVAQFYPTLDSRRPSYAFYQAPDPLLSVPGQPPPPYPEIFEELEERVTAMLSDSLDRFVVATFNNVGISRAYCGCAGGTVIGLIGSVPILLANFLTGGSRWWRFSALPGLWLGMTILISAMFGVCMMIYVFGDLRQLRSFELARFPVANALDASPVKTEKDRKAKDTLTLFPKPQRCVKSDASGTSPAPQSMSGEASVSQSPYDPSSPPVSRSMQPKIRLVPPAPAHAYTHIHTSSRAQPSHAQMQSMSSASTSYSMTSQKPVAFPVSHDSICDADDDYSASESDYDSDSDYESGSETEASSDESNVRHTCEETCKQAGPSSAKCGRRRAHRRRREPEIHISDAIYDEDPSPEGPAMGDMQERARRSSIWGEDSDEELGNGATFIHPFRWDQLGESMTCNDIEAQANCATEHQRIDAFDFEGLPRRSPRHNRSDSTSLPTATTPRFATPSSFMHAAPVDLEKPSRGVHFASDIEAGRTRPLPVQGHNRSPAMPGPLHKALGTLQTKCSPRNVAMYLMRSLTDSTSTVAASESANDRSLELHTSISGGPISPTSTLSPPSVIWPGSPMLEKTPVGRPKVQTKTTWQKRVKRMLQVPAFASPLTPVLNPIVTRGQWEIVVRSAIIAFLLSATIIGALVGAPETRAF